MRGSGEAGVAASAAAAFGCDPGLAVFGEVEELLAGFVVKYCGADWDLDGEACAFVTGAVAAFAMTAALGSVFGVEAEVQQGVAVDGGDHDDIAAAAAVAAGRTAMGNVLLAAEGENAVTAVAGFDGDSYFV